jgi:dienelactone hydrolase
LIRHLICPHKKNDNEFNSKERAAMAGYVLSVSLIMRESFQRNEIVVLGFCVAGTLVLAMASATQATSTSKGPSAPSHPLDSEVIDSSGYTTEVHERQN